MVCIIINLWTKSIGFLHLNFFIQQTGVYKAEVALKLIVHYFRCVSERCIVVQNYEASKNKIQFFLIITALPIPKVTILEIFNKNTTSIIQWLF